MHKDKPPGLFDLAERSVQHAIWLGLASGVLLSVLVQAGLLVSKIESGSGRPRASAQEAHRAMTAHKTPGTPPPAPTAAVKY